MFDEHHCPCQPGWGHMSIFMSHRGQRKLDILAFSSRFYTIPVDGAPFTHSRDTNIPQTKRTIGNFSWIVLSNQKFKASEPTVQPSFFPQSEMNIQGRIDWKGDYQGHTVYVVWKGKTLAFLKFSSHHMPGKVAKGGWTCTSINDRETVQWVSLPMYSMWPDLLQQGSCARSSSWKSGNVDNRQSWLPDGINNLIPEPVTIPCYTHSKEEFLWQVTWRLQVQSLNWS